MNKRTFQQVQNPYSASFNQKKQSVIKKATDLSVKYNQEVILAIFDKTSQKLMFYQSTPSFNMIKLNDILQQDQNVEFYTNPQIEPKYKQIIERPPPVPIEQDYEILELQQQIENEKQRIEIQQSQDYHFELQQQYNENFVDLEPKNKFQKLEVATFDQSTTYQTQNLQTQASVHNNAQDNETSLDRMLLNDQEPYVPPTLISKQVSVQSTKIQNPLLKIKNNKNSNNNIHLFKKLSRETTLPPQEPINQLLQQKPQNLINDLDHMRNWPDRPSNEIKEETEFQKALIENNVEIVQQVYHQFQNKQQIQQPLSQIPQYKSFQSNHSRPIRISQCSAFTEKELDIGFQDQQSLPHMTQIDNRGYWQQYE